MPTRIQQMRILILGCCMAGILISPISCRPSALKNTVSQATKSYQATGELIPAGELMDDQISFQYAIYFLPNPKIDPLEELGRLLNTNFQELKHIEVIAQKPSQQTVWTKLELDPKTALLPPSMESLPYAGKGLTPEQAESLQQTKGMLILTFAHPKNHVWDGLKSATKLAHLLAQSTGGLIWDAETREIFSPEHWETRRITGWSDAIPDISKHTVIHAYQKDELNRAITLGMSKFGLPDIVVEQMSRSNYRNVGHIINLFTQAMAEGAAITTPGQFDLDFRFIKHHGVRDGQVAALFDQATGIALLTLREGTWEEGDPKNRLVEITFERGVGPDSNAQQEDILIRAFGVKDSFSRVQHDEELKEASQRARQKLSALRVAFQQGLPPGELLLVKAPFKTPSGGNEWMWVEIISWRGEEIGGLLQNEPFDIPDLKAGQAVKVSEAEVFDYIRRYSDGTVEGNETAKVIEKQGQ